MHKPKLHSLRFLFRKPYRILLCVFANLLVMLFTVIEGAEMTGTRAAMDAAMESRIYTGTIGHTLYTNSAGIEICDPESTVTPEAAEILRASPYVGSVRTAKRRTARFGEGKTYVQGDAAEHIMFVGLAREELRIRKNDEAGESQLFMILPTYIAAGDPDAVSVGYGEGKLLPTVIVFPAVEGFETHRDERFFLFAQAIHSPKRPTSNVSVSGFYTDPSEYEPGRTLLVRAGPEDEGLSDEEFARKVIEAYGLTEQAGRLNDILNMTTVTRLPSVDMLLPWRNGLMKIVSGRALGEEDAGKKVCMIPSAMLTALGKRVGDTIQLSLSDHDLASGYSSGYAQSGIPSIARDYDPGDFGAMEEYEVVGTYSNNEAESYNDPTALLLTDILIPSVSGSAEEPCRMDRFSFTVHKDDYDAFRAETVPLLSGAGYSVVMVTPEYAEIESSIAEFRDKSGSTLGKAGAALAAGLLIAAAVLLLFWRSDYLTERRLGARKREAAGMYFLGFGTSACLSLLVTLLAVLILGHSGLAPFLAPAALTVSSWGILAAFAASELLAYALISCVLVLLLDRRHFARVKRDLWRSAAWASDGTRFGRRGQNLMPILRKRRLWAAFAAVVLLLLISVAFMDRTADGSRREMERTIEEMSVTFRLSGGRRNDSTAFSVEFSKLRQLQHMEYFENFVGGGLSLTVVAGENVTEVQKEDPTKIPEYLTVFSVPDPASLGLSLLEGDLGEGIWLPRELAEKYGVSAGDDLTVFRPSMGKRGTTGYDLHVAAVTDSAKTYASEACFDSLFEFCNTVGDLHLGSKQLRITSNVSVGGISFHLKKEYNTRLSEIEGELQSLLNTPHPQDRNRDVTVSYNSAEIDGMLEPLERTIASAEFFGKLFRIALPAVAYLIEILALFGLRNEIGVRRFFGEKPGMVFREIWLPAVLLSLPGYLLSVLLLLTPLGAFAPWDLAFGHLAGTIVLTALLTGLLCALRPLALLREKDL